MKSYKLFAQYLIKKSTEFDAGIADLRDIRTLLNNEHQFMLTLLQHPAMNAHEKFYDLVWALFHLEDELNQSEFKFCMFSTSMVEGYFILRKA